MKNATGILFFLGCVLALAHIWYPHILLTCDGPAHVYNAQVIGDLTTGKTLDFYQRFYSLSHAPNPNWLSHYVLVFLLHRNIGGIDAEKTLMTLYVLLYVVGFYLLLKKLSGNNRQMYLYVFIFLFSQVFAKGFYNFCIGNALFFWATWVWILFLERGKFWTAALFFVTLAMVYFAHLLWFSVCGIVCCCLALSFAMAQYPDWAGRMRFGASRMLCLAAMGAPFLWLAIRFSRSQGGLGIRIRFHLYRLVELLQLKYLVNLTHAEVYFALILGCVLIAACLTAIYFGKAKQHVFQKFDGILWGLGILGLLYLCFPDAIFGVEVMTTIRLQVVLGIFMICTVAYLGLPPKLARAMTGIVTLAVVLLAGTRLSAYNNLSDETEELLSCSSHIKPKSVVLPLNFSKARKDNCNGMAWKDQGWFFVHASEYMGLDKPLIFLDNYEAGTKFFPLSWANKANPFLSMISGNGIEQAPPHASIQAYKDFSGIDVDYVVMWCYDPSFELDSNYIPLAKEIRAHFVSIYKSPTGLAELFERIGH